WNSETSSTLYCRRRPLATACSISRNTASFSMPFSRAMPSTMRSSSAFILRLSFFGFYLVVRRYSVVVGAAFRAQNKKPPGFRATRVLGGGGGTTVPTTDLDVGGQAGLGRTDPGSISRPDPQMPDENVTVSCV